MAEQKSRIYSLPEITEINDDMYLMLDASDTGARRFNLKTFYDKVDGVQASADAANTAATAAAAAVDSANQAAQQAASAAESATTTVQGLVDDVDEALDAIEDISEQAVPLMSENVRGGAKLGTGLEVSGGTLFVNTTASGDGSQAGPILSLTAKGWAEQDSTTGKNLLPNTAASQTRNGVTFTKNADGSVTANGTATSVAAFIICGTDIVNATLANGSTYTISGASVADTFIQLWTNDNKTSGDYRGTFTWNGPSENCNFAIYVSSGVTLNNATFYPQLELGSTATAYEPYTGGAPSPSPDYAQEIRVCRGRNLLDASAFLVSTINRAQISSPYLDANTNEVVYTCTGKDTFFGMASNDQSATYVAAFGPKIPVMAGKTYTLSITNTLFRKNYITFFGSNDVRVPDANTDSFGGIANSSYELTACGLSYTFVAPAGATYFTLRFGYGQSTSGAVYRVGLQLERGSVAHGYIPYGDYVGMEAHTRNLLPSELGITGSVDIAFMNQVIGDKYADGQLTFGSSSNNYHGIVFDYILNIGTTYTLSMNNHLSQDVRIASYDTSGQAVTLHGVIRANSSSSLTFVAQHRALLIYAGMNGATSGVSGTISSLQLELGSTATEYEPYYQSTTPIPLPSRGWAASLPDGTADTLTLDGAGKVTWERKCEEVVLDGIAYTASYVATFALSNRATILPAVSYARAHSDSTGFAKDLLSDHFMPNNYVITEMNRAEAGEIAIFSNNVLYITMTKSFSTAESVKAWLQSNPVTVLYPLANPVTEDAGYIEMPEIPVGAEITIPELDDLGVKYCVDASARDLAMMWYDRARDEYADRLDGLDDDLSIAVNDLVTTGIELDAVTLNELYNAQVINGTYAGRNIQTILGTSSFDATISALHSRIASANFSGLRVGDFLNVNCGAYGTVRFDIAHFDPYYQMGNTAMGHHIAFVAHKPIALPSGDAYGTGTNNTYLAWNTTNTNQGTEAENCPYMCSHLHDWEINKLLPAMPTSLTNNLIDRWEYLETRYAAAGGLMTSTGRAWRRLGKVWSLSEMEVYGAVAWGTPGQSVGIGRQFDIFHSINSQLHGERTNWWLRTPSGISAFDVCDIDGFGVAHMVSTTNDRVRSRSGFLLG